MRGVRRRLLLPWGAVGYGCGENNPRQEFFQEKEKKEVQRLRLWQMQEHLEPRHHSWLGNLNIDTLLLGSGRAFCLVDVICTVPIGVKSRKRSMPALLNTSGVVCLSGDRTRKCLNLGSFLQSRKSLNWLKKTNWKQRLALQRHSGWGKEYFVTFSASIQPDLGLWVFSAEVENMHLYSNETWFSQV